MSYPRFALLSLFTLLIVGCPTDPESEWTVLNPPRTGWSWSR